MKDTGKQGNTTKYNTECLYKNNKNYFTTNHEISEMFETNKGLSPILFTLIMDEAIKETKNKIRKYEEGYWNMNKIEIAEICYADHMVIYAEDDETLNKNLNIYNEALRKHLL